MDEIMDFDQTKIGKTTRGKRAQCGILDDYRESDPNDILKIVLPLLKIHEKEDSDKSQD